MKFRSVCKWLLILVLAATFLPLLFHHWRFEMVPLSRPLTIARDVVASVNVTTLASRDPPHRRLIGRMRMAGGRLGNEMFIYASVLGIADRNNMIPVYRSSLLKLWFNITAEESSPFEVSLNSGAVTEASAFMVDGRFNNVASMYTGDVTIVGFFQCWRYFDSVKSRVRQQFQFHREVRDAASSFLRTNTRFDGNVVYIGVHIRRTDMLADYNVRQGYTVADEAYLRRAVAYMTDVLTKQRTDVTQPLKVIYVVCTDDIQWSKEHVAAAVANSSLIDYASVSDSGWSTTVAVAPPTPSVQPSTVFRPTSLTDSPPGGSTAATVATPAVRAQIIYSQGYTSGQDLAILSQCNHTIMTVGTYGWWAGYLAGGLTVYYKDFPAERSSFHSIFKKDDFFPPDWIGL